MLRSTAATATCPGWHVWWPCLNHYREPIKILRGWFQNYFNRKWSENELPCIDAFYNELKECKITLNDYENTVKTFELSNLNSLLDYLELYCLFDVFFLADIFLNWCEVIFKNYDLDIVQYLTPSSYSFDVMLLSKYKENPNFKLELIDDEELYNKIGNNVWVGFCTLVKHHANFKNVCTMMSEMNESNIWNFNVMTDTLNSKNYSKSLNLPR